MSLEQIIEKIEKETEIIVDDILNKAGEKEKETLALAESEAKRTYAELVKRGQEKARMTTSRIVAQEQLEQRKEILKQKQDILSGLYKKIFQELAVLPKQKYQALIKKIILDTIESGPGEIFISPKDKGAITADFIDEVNKEVKKRKINAKLELSSQQINIEGGFILRQGMVEHDCSFNTLSKALREELEEEIIPLLFKEN